MRALAAWRVRGLRARAVGAVARRGRGPGTKVHETKAFSPFRVRRARRLHLLVLHRPCLDVFHVYCTRSNCRKMSLLMYLSQQPDARKSVLMKPHATCTTQIACG